ncbi:MAG: STAS domain-containing protein, partial [Pseudomonadales bacterium]
EAIIVGFALGSVLFIHRMSTTTAIESHRPFVAEDEADYANGREPYDENLHSDPNVVVYRISGAFFFGAAAAIGAALERTAVAHKALIIDFAAVPFLDSTAAHTIESLARRAARRGVRVILTSTSHEIRRELFVHGIKPPLVAYKSSITKAVAG